MVWLAQLYILENTHSIPYVCWYVNFQYFTIVEEDGEERRIEEY